MDKTDYGFASYAQLIGPETRDISASVTIPTDTYFTSQWHLNNTGQTGGLAGIDLNVLPVWDDYKGAGVTVAVIDDGFDLTHSDLAANFDTVNDWDAREGDSDPTYATGDDHGTAVAGVIGADDNGTGSVGVAPDATLAGIRIGYGADFQIWDLDDAMGRMKNFDIVNNSWGFTGSFSDDRANPWFVNTFAAIADAANNGRSGLGSVIFFAAGNARASGDNSNYHNLLNDTQTIAVGAISSDGTYAGFSSKGANILVSAPGEAIVTTDVEGADGYLPGDVVNISGTSFSTPAVAGVVALMLQANSQLGYRDVQEILANASRQIDAGYADWQVNGADHWNGGGMQFSHQYGYGLVDAHAAVRLAESWAVQSTAATLDKVDSPSTLLSVSGANAASSTLSIINDMRVEQIEVSLSFTGNFTSEGQSVVLIAPDGTESVLIDQIGLTAAGNQGGRALPANLDFTFNTVAHWGSQINGTWRLEYRDGHTSDNGSIQWSMRFHGEATHANDTYIYTDSYGSLALQSGRSTLTDFDGGLDVLNLSAVTSASLIDLSAGAGGQVAGQQLAIGATTQIEALIGGDGNDVFTGNTLDNEIFGGRGNDTITASAGADTLHGNDGNDLYVTGHDYQNLISASIAQDGAVILQASDGTDTLYGFESYDFNGQSMTHAQLVQAITTPANPQDIDATLRWSGGGSYQFTANNTQIQTLSYNDLAISGGSGAVLSHGTNSGVTSIQGDSAVFTSLTINNSLNQNLDIDGVSFSNITLGNGGNSQLSFNDIDTLSLVTGDGDDQITVTLNDNGAGYFLNTLDTHEGNDRITINSAAGATGTQLQVNTGAGADELTHTGGARLILNSGAGADDITSADAADTVLTEDGNDTVHANGGADTITTGSGNDTVYGGTGNDQIRGEDDNDILHGEAGLDLIFGGAGNDTIHGGDDNDFIFGDEGSDTINGDDGDDIIYGGDHIDTINGGAGRDQIHGEDGDDNIQGGLERDTIFGGAGVDTISGDEGDDLIYGDAGDDIINGGDGADILYGNAGSDTLNGEGGNDRVLAREGANTLSGGAGDDTIFGAEGRDIIDGDDDDDLISGGLENDTIRGGAGEDVIYGAAGDDTIEGGDDNDRINGDDGNDTLRGGKGVDILSGDNNNDMIYGDEGNDWLYGGNGDDVIEGGEGSDYLYGRNDIDILMGGIGVDSLDGGAGDDILVGGQGVDYLLGGSGSDTFRASVDEDSTDAILDWGINVANDTIDLSLLLGDFTRGVDNLNDFVDITYNASINGSTVNVNRDGAGNDWEAVFDVHGTDLSQLTNNQMLSLGFMIVD